MKNDMTTKKIGWCITVLMLLLTACQSSTTEQQAETTTPSTVAVPDSMFVDVDSTGLMRFGGHEFQNLDSLQVALADTLQVLKAQGGKVPALGYHTHGDVLMGMRGALNDVFLAVQEGAK